MNGFDRWEDKKKQPKIWLIGGTQESAIIAKAIADKQLACVVTVATKTAKTLYPQKLSVKIGRMNAEAMKGFCRQENIAAIVDASHPYATEVSQNAIATANIQRIPYLRYERPLVQLSVSSDRSSVVKLSSFEALFKENYLQGERVLLTIGCQNLHLFKSLHKSATLFARILPKPESLTMALAAGFRADRIIAIRPPINKDLEKALWQQWQLSLVVTKASGKAGGVDIKREVARELHIPLIIIPRPQIKYPQQTSSLDEAIAFSLEQGKT